MSRERIKTADKHCERCDSVFTPSHNHIRFCSRACHRPKPIKNCENCGTEFQPQKKTLKCCSTECSQQNPKRQKPKTEMIKLTCKLCKKEFIKIAYLHRQRHFKFCGRKCSDEYVKSVSRSSGEEKLVNWIKENYPMLQVIQNDRIIFKGLEIDIWIPELKLAIEWNGPFHYQPIFGEKTLLKQQNRDKRKSELAFENNIQLVTIPQLQSITKKYWHQVIENLKPIIDSMATTNFSEEVVKEEQ